MFMVDNVMIDEIDKEKRTVTLRAVDEESFGLLKAWLVRKIHGLDGDTK